MVRLMPRRAGGWVGECLTAPGTGAEQNFVWEKMATIASSAWQPRVQTLRGEFQEAMKKVSPCLLGVSLTVRSMRS